MNSDHMLSFFDISVKKREKENTCWEEIIKLKNFGFVWI